MAIYPVIPIIIPTMSQSEFLWVVIFPSLYPRHLHIDFPLIAIKAQKGTRQRLS